MRVAINRGVRVAEGAHGELVVMAAWCQRCEQESMPRKDGRCGFCESLILDEDKLSAKALRAQLDSGAVQVVTDVAAPLPPLEPRQCKTDGCVNEANGRYRNGTFSGLCEAVCIPARRVQVSAQVAASWERRRARQLQKVAA